MVTYPVYQIYARDLDGVIGADNDLPWKCSQDLKFFKRATLGNVLIVGRNTYDSLPPLSKRHLIVVSTSMTEDDIDEDKPAKLFDTVEAAIEYAQTLELEPVHTTTGIVYIAGGAQLYKSTQPLVDGIVENIILHSDDFEDVEEENLITYIPDYETFTYRSACNFDITPLNTDETGELPVVAVSTIWTKQPLENGIFKYTASDLLELLTKLNILPFQGDSVLGWAHECLSKIKREMAIIETTLNTIGEFNPVLYAQLSFARNKLNIDRQAIVNVVMGIK